MIGFLRPAVTGVVAVFLAAVSVVALADAVDVAGGVRLRGCAGVPGTTVVLHRDAALARVARDVARGIPLAQSLRTSPYVSNSVALFRFEGDYSEATFAAALGAQFCRSLTDPAMTEIGTFGAPAGVWIVLAGHAGPMPPQSGTSVGRHAHPTPVPELPGRLTQLDDSAIERDLLSRINAARAHARRCADKWLGPAPPLQFVSTLERVAAAHSADMARHHEFDHAGHDGSTPAQRVRRTGYPARLIGENIAYGAMSSADAVAGWLASPAHCENIMDARFTETGIAVAAEQRRAGLYFTEVFVQPPEARASETR